jgi:hypothetical protein
MNQANVHFGAREIEGAASVAHPGLRNMMLKPVLDHARHCVTCKMRLTGILAVLESQKQAEDMDN